MSRYAALEQRIDELTDYVRGNADDARDTAGHWLARGQRLVSRWRGQDASRRVARAAENLADEANYQYRRLRRQVVRHPVATVAVVAGAVGALVLLRQALRDRRGD